LKLKDAVNLLTFLIILVFSTSSFATVEWTISKTLEPGTTPIDMAVSRNGKWIFVLTDQGNLLIYSNDGSLKEKIKLGQSVDQIKAGPTEDLLLLRSKKDKTVQVLSLDFVQNINILGSPFKGSPDAPVVIAVFAEFQ
jgi:hypothetical protein